MVVLAASPACSSLPIYTATHGRQLAALPAPAATAGARLAAALPAARSPSCGRLTPCRAAASSDDPTPGTWWGGQTYQMYIMMLQNSWKHQRPCVPSPCFHPQDGTRVACCCHSDGRAHRCTGLSHLLPPLLPGPVHAELLFHCRTPWTLPLAALTPCRPQPIQPRRGSAQQAPDACGTHHRG